MTVKEHHEFFNSYIDWVLKEKDREMRKQIKEAEYCERRSLVIRMLNYGMVSEEISKILRIELSEIEKFKAFNLKVLELGNFIKNASKFE